MKNLRFWLGDALICMPLVTLVAGGWLFLRTVVPELEHRESERVRGVWHELAVAIRDGEIAARDCTPSVRKPLGRLGNGNWGAESTDAGLQVWYRAPRSQTFRGVTVPPVETYDYRRLFWTVGLVVLSLMTILTDLGLRFFRRRTREREDFMAAAVHDLVTPLVGMRRLIGRDDEEARRLNERMLRLIDNIRDYLRLGGHRPVRLTEFPVGRAFDEAYRLFADDFAEAESGPLKVSGDREIMVRFDETLLVQIFWNLLGNDLKYASGSGPVAARFETDGRQLRFVLADCGPGMSSSQRKHAFDRYYRTRSAVRSGKGGFGIGLCTARELACQCGGELSVSANRPQGCIFQLSLPLA